MNTELLAAIREELAHDNNGSEALWNVLTALRGPDDGNSVVKEATTQVIRHRLLGRRPEQSWSVCGSLVSPDYQQAVELRKKLGEDHTGTVSSVHFIWHARKAFEALGLKWDELNP